MTMRDGEFPPEALALFVRHGVAQPHRVSQSAERTERVECLRPAP